MLRQWRWSKFLSEDQWMVYSQHVMITQKVSITPLLLLICFRSNMRLTRNFLLLLILAGMSGTETSLKGLCHSLHWFSNNIIHYRQREMRLKVLIFLILNVIILILSISNTIFCYLCLILQSPLQMRCLIWGFQNSNLSSILTKRNAMDKVFQVHQEDGAQRREEGFWIWRTVSTLKVTLRHSFFIHWEIALSDISTIIPTPRSPLLQSSVLLVPFDPKIPLITYLSLLGMNTFRILTETEDSLSSPSTRQSQENNLILQNDPMCGLTAGGGGCELDCDIDPDAYAIYSDPTCLRDCPQYPACFQQLYRDFETAGRVGIIK